MLSARSSQFLRCSNVPFPNSFKKHVSSMALDRHVNSTPPLPNPGAFKSSPPEPDIKNMMPKSKINLVTCEPNSNSYSRKRSRFYLVWTRHCIWRSFQMHDWSTRSIREGSSIQYTFEWEWNCWHGGGIHKYWILSHRQDCDYHYLWLKGLRLFKSYYISYGYT